MTNCVWKKYLIVSLVLGSIIGKLREGRSLCTHPEETFEILSTFFFSPLFLFLHDFRTHHLMFEIFASHL
jgi:hypothetical protein